MNNCKEFRYLEISFVSNYFIRNIANKRMNENLVFAGFKEIISVASISIYKSDLLLRNFRKIRNASIGRDLSIQFFRFNSTSKNLNSPPATLTRVNRRINPEGIPFRV